MYKRQVFSDQLAAAVKDGRLTQEKADLMIAGQKPVSYTHLDVYKRQSLD